MIGAIIGLVIQTFILLGCMRMIIGKNAIPDFKPLFLLLFVVTIIFTVLLSAIGLFAIVINFAMLVGILWLFYRIDIVQCLTIVGIYTGIIFLWAMIGAMI